jgi:hypothetical protein
MLRRVALVRTDVSEERSVSIICVTRIGELGIAFAVTSNRRTLRRNTASQKTAFFIIAAVKTSDLRIQSAKIFALDHRTMDKCSELLVMLIQYCNKPN